MSTLATNKIGTLAGTADMSLPTSRPSSTKSGLAGLNRGVALDLAKYNILSNCVSPVFVDTQLTRRILKKKNMKIVEKQIPLKRLASEEEIAELVVFLCSDKNSYITGQDLTIDGGFTIK